MKIYKVGGCVRDAIMGIPSNDTDFVVVGATSEQMINAGFKQVGNDFPVFLHPETNDEYALARREVSTGNGYNDFRFEFDTGVSLYEDMIRRDFTINAIAMDEQGNIVDPHGFAKDITERRLAVINTDAFKDDPVRILRLARFSAQFPSFTIDDQTLELAAQGDIKHATAERVALELKKALKAIKPSNFFRTLHKIGQLDFWFPEVHALIGQTQPIKHHAEGDAFEHTMMVVDAAARAHESVMVVFGCLVHDFGKGSTPKHKLPKHHGHEQAGVPLVLDFVDRLKLENVFKRNGINAARYHTHVHKVNELRDSKFVDVAGSIRTRDVAEVVAKVAFFDNEGKLPFVAGYNNHDTFIKLFDAATTVKLSDHFTDEQIKSFSVDNCKNKHHNVKIAAVKAAR